MVGLGHYLGLFLIARGTIYRSLWRHGRDYVLGGVANLSPITFHFSRFRSRTGHDAEPKPW